MFPKTPSSIYQSPKCFVTYGRLDHLDPAQIPKKRKPWSSFSGQRFVQRVDIIVPEESYQLLRPWLIDHTSHPTYSRVTMPLSHILDKDFLLKHIKQGNVSMLSEGKTTVDNVFMLREGVLTMYLDKEAYERAGLVGKPHGAKGGRGLKPRWIVSYDLHSSAMVHGKKGFDRLLYACRYVFDQPLTWLFCNVNKSTPEQDPLEINFPVRFTSAPAATPSIHTTGLRVSVPSEILLKGDRQGLEDAAIELYEWLSLIRLGSPRVLASDTVDPYLCRYSGPEGVEGQMQVCKISWVGFFSPHWVRNLLSILTVNSPSQNWFFLSSTEPMTAVNGASDEIAFLRLSGASEEYIMYEIESQG